MAVWQFDTFVVPAAKVPSSPSGTIDRLTEAEYESIMWWEGCRLPPDYAEVLSALLPPASSWSREVQIWGQQDGNSVSVARQRGTIEEVRFRFDVRDVNIQLIESLVRIASEWHCVLVTEEHEIVPMEATAVLSEIKNSSAYRYLLDPPSFLAQEGELP